MAKVSKKGAGKTSGDAKYTRLFSVEGRGHRETATPFPPLWQVAIAKAGGKYQMLAELWGVSHMTVYRWGRGVTQPTQLEKWGIRDWCRTQNISSPV